MALLSPEYRRAAIRTHVDPVFAAIATGDTDGITDTRPLTDAILRGFDKNNARRDLMDLARNSRRGEATLRAVTLLDDGYAGDLNALTQALATLRALGQEDTVRRAALQILLLDRTI